MSLRNINKLAFIIMKWCVPCEVSLYHCGWELLSTIWRWQVPRNPNVSEHVKCNIFDVFKQGVTLRIACVLISLILHAWKQHSALGQRIT